MKEAIGDTVGDVGDGFCACNGGCNALLSPSKKQLTLQLLAVSRAVSKQMKFPVQKLCSDGRSCMVKFSFSSCGLWWI